MNKQNKIKTGYIDVFDELDQIKRQSNIRRSFSLPDSYNDDVLLSSIDDTIEYPDPPPPSPELELYPITIEIPDDNLNNITYSQNSDDEIDLHINDIQNFINFPKTELIISSPYDNKLYKQPSKKSFDARYIWKSAKIPSVSYIYNIECLLLNWAYTYADLEIIDTKINKIKWKSKSNCECESTWRGFLKWIICASLSV